MTSKLIAEIRGSAGYLVLNAPLRRNALSLDMWGGIPEIIGRFEQDAAVRSIVVTGSGHEAFAAPILIELEIEARETRQQPIQTLATLRAAGLEAATEEAAELGW